jgi:hypothetical protein
VPSPHGYGYLAQRAMVQGHDRYLTAGIEGDVDLTPAQVLLTFADATYSHLSSWLGWVVTRVAPNAIPERFDVSVGPRVRTTRCASVVGRVAATLAQLRVGRRGCR